MEKINEYFVPINQASKDLGVPAHTLRYWEKQFPDAIRPMTGAGNRRYYRADTIQKLRGIKSLLYDRGMTIAGVKKILHNGTFNEEIANIPEKAGEKIQQTMAQNNINDIDKAIDLLNQAKMFLE